VRHEREVHNLREHFVCNQRGCNARIIRRSYIVNNKHHLSEYKARAHAVAAKKLPVASNKTSYYESVSDSESILDILEELDSTLRSPYHPETETEKSINYLTILMKLPFLIGCSVLCRLIMCILLYVAWMSRTLRYSLYFEYCICYLLRWYVLRCIIHVPPLVMYYVPRVKFSPFMAEL